VLVARIGRGAIHLFEVVRLDRRAVEHLEVLRHTEVLEESRNPTARVEQLDGRRRTAFRCLTETNAQASQHTQKGTVHQLALREVEDEAFMPLVAKAEQQCAKIDAASAPGSARDLYANKLLVHPYFQADRSGTHTTSCSNSMGANRRTSSDRVASSRAAVDCEASAAKARRRPLPRSFHRARAVATDNLHQRLLEYEPVI